jgi:hypothetical protein
MSDTSLSLLTAVRADLSKALFHFTRELENGRSAFPVLKDILVEGVIRGTGFGVRGVNSPSAACFTETPFASIKAIATAPDEYLPRHGYRPYGVAISKSAGIEIGARPVIYLPKEDMKWVPPEESWRLVEMSGLSGKGFDFTHEREWRAKGDVDLRKLPGLIVLVWSREEAKEINALPSPVSKMIRAVLPMKYFYEYF